MFCQSSEILYCTSQVLLLPIQCSPLVEYYRSIAHAGCDNKGAKNICRCKLKTVWLCYYGMLQLSTLCLKAFREVLSTNGCGSLSHILILSRKKECLYVEVLAYWTRNRAMWTLTTDAVVCSSSGGIATRPFTIVYTVHHTSFTSCPSLG